VAKVKQPRKSVKQMKKKIFEDEEGSSSSGDEKLIKNLKMGVDGAENDAAIKEQMDALRKEKEEKKRAEDEADGLFDSESDEERDLSVLNDKQRDQYERHMKVIKNLKEQRYPHNLYHELMTVRLDQVEGMTDTEFRRKVMGFVRKLPIMYQEDVKNYLGEIKA
jgi:hypothetical protein